MPRPAGDPVIADVTYQRDIGEKRIWPKIGTAFIDTDLRIRICLDSLPIQPWDGNLIIFGDRPRDKERKI